MLKKRPLGNTEIQISEIGLGTVKFGRNQGIKYPKPFELPTNKTIIELLAYAEDLGINVLDTAAAYGCSEARLGECLTPHQRQQWVLISKAGEEFEQGESSYIYTPEHLKFSLQRSLKRLKTDYLDAFLIHSDGQDLTRINHDDVFASCLKFKDEGLIRSFGMSTKTVEGGISALHHSDMAMVTYNPLHTEEAPVLTEASALNKGIIIKKAFASGHLSQFNHPDPVKHTVQFILNNSAVSTLITGTLNKEHLLQTVIAASD